MGGGNFTILLSKCITCRQIAYTTRLRLRVFTVLNINSYGSHTTILLQGYFIRCPLVVGGSGAQPSGYLTEELRVCPTNFVDALTYSLTPRWSESVSLFGSMSTCRVCKVDARMHIYTHNK